MGQKTGVMGLVVAALASGCVGTTPLISPPPAIRQDADGTFLLSMGPFRVGPGEERYVCQDFANPFGGDAAIARFASSLTPGAHHLLLFYKPAAADRPLEDCSGTEFAAGPYGSQRSDDELAYPDGVAAAIPAGTGFRAQAHYLNATAAPIDATVTVRMTPATVVRERAAVLFFSNLYVNVPAGGHDVVAEKSCILPFPVNLVQSSGHMHRHGTRFFATAGATATTPAQTLFDARTTDAPPAVYDPPLPLPAGTPVTFRCTYDNDGPTAIGYGDSAAADEMCIFSAQFYPAPFGGWSCF